MGVHMKKLSRSALLTIVLTGAPALWGAPPADDGLVLNFQNAPLQAVLDDLSEKAGLIVVAETPVRGNFTAESRQPVSISEAVGLLNDELSRLGYNATLNGRTLTITVASGARTNALTPVVSTTDPAGIPLDNEIVTDVLPVHALKPAQLLKDLEALIPGGDTVTANEAGNALLMTASRKDIHRMASIIKALDSTAISEVHVLTLQNADAKSVAGELKELFQAGDSENSRPGALMDFGARFGRSRAAGESETTQKTAPTRSVFVADEQMNAIAISAAPEEMPMILKVAGALDHPGQELTEIEVFPLLHADPEEVVDEVSELFAPVAGTGAPEQAARVPGPRFSIPGLMQAGPGPDAESNRVKRQATVTIVADRRAQMVLAAASASAMAQVRKVIARLDEGSAGTMVLSVHPCGAAYAETVEEAMTALFGGSSQSGRTSTTIITPWGQRELSSATSQSAPSASNGPLSGSGGAGAIH